MRILLKKEGEESTEVIIAAKAEDKKETVYEIADLAYHVMVLMAEAGISLEDVRAELAFRHGIDKKVKQEKVTSRRCFYTEERHRANGYTHKAEQGVSDS